jgi:hypothetical protein
LVVSSSAEQLGMANCILPTPNRVSVKTIGKPFRKPIKAMPKGSLVGIGSSWPASPISTMRKLRQMRVSNKGCIGLSMRNSLYWEVPNRTKTMQMHSSNDKFSLPMRGVLLEGQRCGSLKNRNKALVGQPQKYWGFCLGANKIMFFRPRQRVSIVATMTGLVFQSLEGQRSGLPIDGRIAVSGLPIVGKLWIRSIFQPLEGWRFLFFQSLEEWRLALPIVGRMAISGFPIIGRVGVWSSNHWNDKWF